MSFSFSALSRDMRPPTVPVRPAPTWTPSPTPSPSLSLSLWRVVVCKLFASLLSRGINLQAIDRCCQRASQAKTQTNGQTAMLFLLFLLLLPTLACQSALLWQDKIIYSVAPLSLSLSLLLLLPAPSLQLSTRELASDRSSLRVAAVAGYKGNLICWQFSVNCRPPFVCPTPLPPCTLLWLPNLICAFLYLWLVDSFSLIVGRFAFRLPIWSESCGRFVKSQ